MGRKSACALSVGVGFRAIADRPYNMRRKHCVCTVREQYGQILSNLDAIIKQHGIRNEVKMGIVEFVRGLRYISGPKMNEHIIVTSGGILERLYEKFGEGIFVPLDFPIQSGKTTFVICVASYYSCIRYEDITIVVKSEYYAQKYRDIIGKFICANNLKKCANINVVAYDDYRGEKAIFDLPNSTFVTAKLFNSEWHNRDFLTEMMDYHMSVYGTSK